MSQFTQKLSQPCVDESVSVSRVSPSSVWSVPPPVTAVVFDVLYDVVQFAAVVPWSHFHSGSWQYRHALLNCGITIVENNRNNTINPTPTLIAAFKTLDFAIFDHRVVFYREVLGRYLMLNPIKAKTNTNRKSPCVVAADSPVTV